MLNKAIILILSLFILSSCVTGPEGYFKKSANNKLFDRSGFKGKKRSPLYNKKYIAKAKKNMALNDYADDEDMEDDLFENENISAANKDMYRLMLEEEVEAKYLGKRNSGDKNRPYPSVTRTNPRAYDNDETDNIELRAELEQIKTMLKQTKSEMSSYRCPTVKDLEAAQDRLQQNSTKKPTMRKKIDEPSNSIIEPVKSI